MQHKIQYLTAKLQEEAAEVIQAVSKINRFGPHNSHPDRTTTNLQELVGELEDFLAIVAALEHYQYIDLTPSLRNIDNKAKALVQG
jgi:NTP pyrophosphatase (non-canonical NTP hydrolase)